MGILLLFLSHVAGGEECAWHRSINSCNPIFLSAMCIGPLRTSLLASMHNTILSPLSGACLMSVRRSLRKVVLGVSSNHPWLHRYHSCCSYTIWPNPLFDLVVCGMGA